MGKLTIDSFKKYQDDKKKEFNKRYIDENEVTILVGMGSCGIAAGAKETLQTLVEQKEKLGLKNITIKQTGCMGSCYVEPTVEVIIPGMPQILYGKVNAQTALKIMEEHVVHKRLVNEHVIDKPSIDIISDKGDKHGV
jgi:NADP-reducing hydrogenase subunit HndB